MWGRSRYFLADHRWSESESLDVHVVYNRVLFLFAERI